MQRIHGTRSISIRPSIARLQQSSSTSTAAASAPQDSKDDGKAVVRRRLYDITGDAARAWLQSTDGRRFESSTSARTWLHPSRPFPKNPWFQPPIPTGDQLRVEMYQEYCSDPVRWTPRRLAIKYGLSVCRVEAILRLKHLERVQVSRGGYVLQTRFARSMEQMMGVGSPASSNDCIKEPVDHISRIRPTKYPAFVLSDSDNDIKASECHARAKDDTMDELKEIKDEVVPLKRVDPSTLPRDAFKRRLDGNYVMALSGVADEPEVETEVFERKNPRQVNSRHRFIIADMSCSNVAGDDTARVLVRDKDGTLRSATLKERRMHFSLFPLSSTAAATTATRGDEDAKGRDLWQI